MFIQDLDNEIQEQIKQLDFNTKKPRKDITGKTFYRLTVLGRGKDYVSPGGHVSSQWWCICECPAHNIILVKMNNLTSGNTKSCGCLDKEKAAERIKKVGHSLAKDISNQIFGELKAIEPTDKRKNGSVIWKCECSCGKIHYVSAHDLIQRRIESCGHTTESKGIRKIKKILNANNVNYITEKTFKDCIFTDSNAYARFDFYVDNRFLLEYDGEQHFQRLDDNYFKDTLEKRKQHDEYKNKWCKEHNIPLKRIPYYELNNITLESIMGEEYLI